MSLVDKMKNQNPKINEGFSKDTPSLKFSKQEIEFLLYLVQEGMIPGKQLIEAVSVVEKLQKSYKEQQ